MQHELAFLHTSPVHVAGFEALVQEMAPGLKVHHQVAPSLLASAQQLGAAHEAVVRDVGHAMQEAAVSGARLVVCTCSRTHFINRDECEQGDSGCSARRRRAAKAGALASGATKQCARIASSRRVCLITRAGLR